MNIEAPKLPLLQQREIEARIVGPLMRAFAAELGQETHRRHPSPGDRGAGAAGWCRSGKKPG